LPDVFISYSRRDQAVARTFAEGFEREGFSVWWDQAINPGDAFDQVTEQALEAASAVVVLWSKASVDSRWVRAEATQANANNRLLPVMIESCRRPIIFELTHTADLSGWDGDPGHPAWQSLVTSVRRLMQRAAPTGAMASTADSVQPPSNPPPALAAPPPREWRTAAAPSSPVTRTAQTIPGKAPAAAGMPRRKVLWYGASALGLFGAGFTANALLRGDPGPAHGPSASFHRLTFRRGLVRSARFAADGQTILYGALWDGELCRVHSTRTDNAESRALELPDANVLAVSRKGDLAISIGPNLHGVFSYGTLARAPIAGGAPRELIEHVKFADWSADGNELAVIRAVDGSDQLEYPLGKVLFRPLADAGTGLGFARISPDGRQVAFIHYRSRQSLIGRVCIADGAGTVTVLTDEYVNIHGLAWRGAEIWYSASSDRPLFRAVLAVKPDSPARIAARVPVNVTLWDAAQDGRLLIAQTDDRAAMIGRLPDDTHERDLSWLDASNVADLSPDGRLVLFSETGQGVGSTPAAYLRAIDGSPAIRLGSGHALALSPDAQSALILGVDRSTADEGQFIDIVPTGAGRSRRLPGRGFSYTSARWMPDGRALVLKAGAQGRPMRLFRVELPDGEHQPVTPEGIGGWVVSPDGASVAVNGLRDGIQLFSFRDDARSTVPGTSGVEWLLGWIDAGLLAMRYGDATAPRGEVFVLDPATGRQRAWANILPRDGAGIMLLQSFATTPDGRTRVFSWHRALSNLYLANGLA